MELKTPGILGLDEDALLGIVLECSSASSGSNEVISAGSRTHVRPATFNVDRKEVLEVSEFVGIELAEPEKYALLVGATSISQGDGRAFVAVCPCLHRDSLSEHDLSSQVHTL